MVKRLLAVFDCLIFFVNATFIGYLIIGGSYIMWTTNAPTPVKLACITVVAAVTGTMVTIAEERRSDADE